MKKKKKQTKPDKLIDKLIEENKKKRTPKEVVFNIGGVKTKFTYQ